MTRPRSPVLGFNHNVRHRGRVYHVQTEDSGVQNPHIFTHVFFEGTILATKKATYEMGATEEVVRALMQQQHKFMLKELRSSKFDPKMAKFFESKGQMLDPTGASTDPSMEVPVAAPIAMDDVATAPVVVPVPARPPAPVPVPVTAPTLAAASTGITPMAPLDEGALEALLASADLGAPPPSGPPSSRRPTAPSLPPVVAPNLPTPSGQPPSPAPAHAAAQPQDDAPMVVLQPPPGRRPTNPAIGIPPGMAPTASPSTTAVYGEAAPAPAGGARPTGVGRRIWAKKGTGVDFPTPPPVAPPPPPPGTVAPGVSRESAPLLPVASDRAASSPNIHMSMAPVPSTSAGPAASEGPVVVLSARPHGHGPAAGRPTPGSMPAQPPPPAQASGQVPGGARPTPMGTPAMTAAGAMKTTAAAKSPEGGVVVARPAVVVMGGPQGGAHPPQPGVPVPVSQGGSQSGRAANRSTGVYATRGTSPNLAREVGRSRTEDPPTAPRVFTEEKSLDEVILAYLAEEAKGPR